MQHIPSFFLHYNTTDQSSRYLDCLMKIYGNHFLHAIFNHLRGEEVCFSPLVHCDLPEVLQQDGTYGLGGVCHVNWTIITHHLAHVWQSSTVIKVEVAICMVCGYMGQKSK